MENYILAINPGSTSTKVALYENETMIFKENIEHDTALLDAFDGIKNQYTFRKECILNTLKKHGYHANQLSIVMGRGGLLPPIKTGGYLVNDKLKRCLLSDDIPQHASNLGGVLADEIAKEAGVSAYIYDAVSANEFEPVAKITGLKEIERKSLYHVLNSRATAINYAESINKNYTDLNLIVAHMGGGITIGVHKNGKIVDSISDDNGSFSPERSGSLPLTEIINMCYSGKYSKEQMLKKIRGNGGLKSLLGVTDIRKVQEMASNGDEWAKLVLEAQVYQVAKGIGLLSPVLKGKCDAIILTGGIAYSEYITAALKEYVGFIAPVVVSPGELEMEALARGGLRILKGVEDFNEF